MSDLRTPSALRSLIEAAKSDGPGAVARAEVWSSVCRSMAVTVAAGSAGFPLGGASSAKAISLASVFGGAVTVGLAAAVLILQPMRSFEQAPSGDDAPAAGAQAMGAPATALSARGGSSWDPVEAPAAGRALDAARSAFPSTGPSRASTADRGACGTTNPPPYGASSAGAPPDDQVADKDAVADKDIGTADRAVGAHGPPPGSAPPAALRSPGRASALTPPPDAPQRVSFDPLAREAALLTRARAALARGDAQAALRAVREAMAVPGRQLVPEEMSVESRALRALGRSRDADALTTELRSRYPDSALAR